MALNIRSAGVEPRLYGRSVNQSPDPNPLAGVTVLDLSTAFAAPYGTALLADLGARVIKVERPDGGDITRHGDRSLEGESGYFIGVNHGKEGLTLDLKKSAGQQVVRRLVPQIDVLVENFRPGLMDSWGLGYEALRALRRDLLYCSLTAYGDARSIADRTGNDMTVQAYSGLMDLTGESDGPPQRAGVPVVDAAGGFNTAIAILGALYRRHSTGRGEHIEVNLLQAAYSLMPNLTATVLNSDAEYYRLGTWHPQFAPCEVFRCGDGGYVSLCVIHDRAWRALCDAIDRPELQGDPRFQDNLSRVENRRVLRGLLEAELASRPRDEWVDRLEEADVTVAPLLSLRESLDRFRVEVTAASREVV